MKETDLYPPVKHLFETMGYRVNAEVHDADMTAVCAKCLVAVELKKTMNLTLIMQALQRQKVADCVYVAVPRKALGKRFSKRRRELEALLKRLGLGLIEVAMDAAVAYAQIALEPSSKEDGQKNVRINRKKRTSMLDEINQRVGDHNCGGVVRKPLVTAYRQNALLLAGLLLRVGPMTIHDLRCAGGGNKTSAIVRDNHYGWFRKDDKKSVEITDKAKQALQAYESLIRDLLTGCVTHNDHPVLIRKAFIREAKKLARIQSIIDEEYIRSHTVFGAFVRDQCVGCASIAHRNNEDVQAKDVYTGARLNILFVEETYRKQGIGRRLFRQVCRTMKENGDTVLYIRCFLQDRAFYDKMGAEHTAMNKQDESGETVLIKKLE